jgi:hypothetical protein
MASIRYGRSFYQALAAVSIALAILSLDSPQINTFGRGLRLTLPALALAGYAIYRISPNAFVASYMRFQAAFVIGLIFVFQAGARFIYAEDATMMWETFFSSPIQVLVFLLWIGANAELGGGAVRQLRVILLFGWCISLAHSIPTLYANYGIARQTMGNQFASENIALWAPLGVGEYTLYTTVAICIPPLLAVPRLMKSGSRWIAYLLIVAAILAVFLSTFTMASALLAIGLFGSYLIWVIASKGVVRLALITTFVALLGAIPIIFTLASSFPQVAFVTQKVDRLASGLTTYGLAEGDETGRGWMFMDEMSAVYEEPFLGYIPHVTGQRGHWHSSFANSLSLFGIFGATLWVLVLGSILLNCLRGAHDSTHQHIIILAWILLILGGILNPIWHSPMALSALLALAVPGRTIPVDQRAVKLQLWRVMNFGSLFRRRSHRHRRSYHRN